MSSESVEDRIGALEARLRRLRRFVFALVLILTVALLPLLGVVQLNRFQVRILDTNCIRVRDAAGKLVSIWGSDAHGPRMNFFAPDGTDTIRLGVTGGEPALNMVYPSNKVGVSLAIGKELKAVLQLRDETSDATICLVADRLPRLNFVDPQGRKRAGMILSPGQSSLFFVDELGSTRVGLGFDANVPTLSLKSPNGDENLGLRLVGPVGVLTMFDSQNQAQGAFGFNFESQQIRARAKDGTAAWTFPPRQQLKGLGPSD